MLRAREINELYKNPITKIDKQTPHVCMYVCVYMYGTYVLVAFMAYFQR